MYALLSRTGNWARNSAGSGIRAILVAVDELTLEHLAGRVARQLVQEHDLARDLVAGQVLTDVVADLVLAQPGPVAPHPERPQPLAEALVLDADRRGLDDPHVTRQQILHLG